MSDEFWKFAASLGATITAIVVAFFSYLTAKRAAKTSEESKAISVENKGAIKEVHLTLNSRLDQWKQETREAAIAAAVAAYKEGQNSMVTKETK